MSWLDVLTVLSILIQLENCVNIFLSADKAGKRRLLCPGYSTDSPETRRVFVRRSVQKPEFYGVRRTRSVLESSNATLHVHALERACTVTLADTQTENWHRGYCPGQQVCIIIENIFEKSHFFNI